MLKEEYLEYMNENYMEFKYLIEFLFSFAKLCLTDFR